jgi:hypothetical protein
MLLQGYPAGKNKSCASGGQASHQNYGPPETKDPTDMAGWRIPQKCNSSGSSKSQAWRPTVRRTHMRGTHAHWANWSEISSAAANQAHDQFPQLVSSVE